VLAIGAQLQLVVGQTTAQFISDLISACGELQFRLIPKVMPMHSLRSDINILNQHYDNTQVEITRVLATMKEHNESGQRDSGRFERLNQSFIFAKERADEIAAERNELWARMNALHRQFLKDMPLELKRLAELQLRVMVELRRDLDVGGDIEIFRLMLRRQLERVDSALDQFDRELFAGGKQDSGDPKNH
jgi:hypothetical protein